jgi:type IV pilus assembly protein PilB
MKLSRRNEPQPIAPPPLSVGVIPPVRVDGNGHGAHAPGTRAPMIGELLVQDGAASAEQVKNALRQQRKDRRPLGELLVQLGVPSARVTIAVGWQLGLAPVDLDTIYIQPEALDTLTALFARLREVVPYGIDDEGRLHVASTKPGDASLAKEVAEAAQRDVQMELADIAGIRRQLDLHYTVLGNVDAAAERAIKETAHRAPTTLLTTVSADAPVVQIVDLIITQGLRDRVSDIHIEPQADRLRVRYRVDGALHDVQSLPPQLGAPVASRLKLLAEMDIVDRHRSQDGQMTMKLDGRDVDIRISSMETVWGEKVVLRLLDRSRSLVPLSQLGLRAEEHERLHKLITSPYGLLMVSGPTGAGKTTTLYAALNELDRKTRNITTIEDPVEYQFDNINQVQINRLAGTTFVNGLRAILRQDPDVILVGEVRDVETAQIAVQSALTGHLVLCSLHAADCVGALHRFLDMGLESFLIASAVIGVVAQRLVRVNCPDCSVPVTPRPEELEFYRLVRGYDPPALMAGTGCRRCKGTGYYERTGVFEALRVDDPIRELIVARESQSGLRHHAQAAGMRTLQESACDLIDAGRTTIAEAMRTVYVI